MKRFAGVVGVLATFIVVAGSCGGPPCADSTCNAGGGATSGGGAATGGGAVAGGGAATGGGGASTGGGAAIGGGTASGGGTATGGGIASGGGAASGGGIASGGGAASGGGIATGGGNDAGTVTGHPNEPAGFTPFTHRPFLVKAPTTANPAIEDGWTDRGDTNSTVVDAASIATLGSGGTSLGDATDPVSPPYVLQERVPVGQVGGSGPILTVKSLSSSTFTELYVDFWWQASSNWHNGYAGGSGNSKLLFVEIGHGNQLIPIISGLGTGTLNLKMAAQALVPGGDVDSSGALTNNLFSHTIQRGRWYRIELYFKKNSADGVADGELKFWLDGTLLADKTAIQYVGSGSAAAKPFATSFFDQIKINPTWSSGSTALLAADGPVFAWYADLYASGKP